MPETNRPRATAQQLREYLQVNESRLVHPQRPYGTLLVAQLAVKRSGVLAPEYVDEVARLSSRCLSTDPPLPEVFGTVPPAVVDLLSNIALEIWGMHAFGPRFAAELIAELPGK